TIRSTPRVPGSPTSRRIAHRPSNGTGARWSSRRLQGKGKKTVSAYGGKNAPGWEVRGAGRVSRLVMRARGCAVHGLLAALAVAAGGCSYCDEYDSWRQATYIATAEAATPLPAPDCAVHTDGAAALAGEAAADPDLVEIARLEIERDCYREAEAQTRQ